MFELVFPGIIAGYFGLLFGAFLLRRGLSIEANE